MRNRRERTLCGCVSLFLQLYSDESGRYDYESEKHAPSFPTASQSNTPSSVDHVPTFSRYSSSGVLPVAFCFDGWLLQCEITLSTCAERKLRQHGAEKRGISWTTSGRLLASCSEAVGFPAALWSTTPSAFSTSSHSEVLLSLAACYLCRVSHVGSSVDAGSVLCAFHARL